MLSSAAIQKDADVGHDDAEKDAPLLVGFEADFTHERDETYREAIRARTRPLPALLTVQQNRP